MVETSEKIKRDMAKCAKRVSEVIECFCEAGELVGCAQDARYELIGGISCIRQLEQEIKQKDERIRHLERESDALMEDFRVYRERNIKKESGVYACDLCKHGGKYEAIEDITCPEGCDGIGHWEWRGVEEENQ